MTKYFCDICGKEVESITQYVIPDWGTKDFTDKKGNILRRTFVTTPKEKDLCKRCASSIHQLIRIYQVALADNENEVIITFPKQKDEVNK